MSPKGERGRTQIQWHPYHDGVKGEYGNIHSVAKGRVGDDGEAIQYDNDGGNFHGKEVSQHRYCGDRVSLKEIIRAQLELPSSHDDHGPTT